MFLGWSEKGEGEEVKETVVELRDAVRRACWFAAGDTRVEK